MSLDGTTFDLTLSHNGFSALLELEVVSRRPRGNT